MYVSTLWRQFCLAHTYNTTYIRPGYLHIDWFHFMAHGPGRWEARAASPSYTPMRPWQALRGTRGRW